MQIESFPRHILAVAVVTTALMAQPAVAQQRDLSEFDRSVFFFGGRFHTDWFSDGANPFGLEWEDNYVLGAGYQQTLLDWHDVRIGGEIGIAGRFGTSASAEFWGGGFIRFDWFTLGDTVRISPALTAGLSIGTGAVGVEAERAAAMGLGQVPLMVYLGPEINLSLVDHPEWEVFWRLHHRSGGYGWIAQFDGANAVTAGFRYKF
jgi:hypothetical protein